MSGSADFRVSVVLVNYRSAADTTRAVAQLRAAEPALALEVIVVDNASGAPDRALLDGLAGVVRIDNPANEGFGRACNRGAAIAGAPFLLFLNPDVVARPGALRRLLGEAEAHPEAALFAPRLVNPDGSPQHNARRFYRWRTVLVRRLPPRALFAGSREDSYHLYAEMDPRTSWEADWAMGAALLVRRADFESLGGFDPGFFLYLEDVDLALRVWRSGRTVRYVGEAEMVHDHRRLSAALWSPRAKRAHLRSMWLFRQKYGGWPRRGEPPEPGRPLVFVQEANGALAERAHNFARALGGAVLAKDGLPGGRIRRALGAAAAVLRLRPRHLHVLDVGVASLLAIVAGRLVRAGVVLDTGDEHYEIQRKTGARRGLLLELHGAVERAALSLADQVVVRGRGHVAALLRRGYNDVCWIPDGVEVARFADATAHPWRAERGWERYLVVASVGSLLVDRRYRSTQGMELVEALAMAPAARGAIVGNGPGLPLLAARARALGVEERLAFLGQVQMEELPALLKSFDVCLSTQSNDPVGEARTTGKLPLFCAAGRFVLASRVGEAGRVLPEEMLVRYDGESDPEYPRRLAERFAAIDAERAVLGRGLALIDRARELYDYPRLAAAAAALAAPAPERLGPTPGRGEERA